MEPETLMTNLANGMIRAHGKLKEVVFLQGGNKNILLLFSDGTMLPTDCKEVSGGRGVAIQAELLKHEFYGTLYKQLGQSPLQFLAFGYVGTGPRCLASFLRGAGFKNFDVENINAPLRLQPDGSLIRGVVQGELVEWGDGKKMTNEGLDEMPKFLKQSRNTKIESSSDKKKHWWEFWK